MRVRRASAADMAEIMPLARAFHAEAPYHRDFPFDPVKVAALLHNAFFSPDWLAIVAQSGEMIAGFSLFFASEMYFGPAREATDLAFYVAPRYRGGRAAFAMMQTIAKWAREGGCVRLSVSPNTGINHEAAGSFLERLGFVEHARIWSLPLPA